MSVRAKLHDDIFLQYSHALHGAFCGDCDCLLRYWVGGLCLQVPRVPPPICAKGPFEMGDARVWSYPAIPSKDGFCAEFEAGVVWANIHRRADSACYSISCQITFSLPPTGIGRSIDSSSYWLLFLMPLTFILLHWCLSAIFRIHSTGVCVCVFHVGKWMASYLSPFHLLFKSRVVLQVFLRAFCNSCDPRIGKHFLHQSINRVSTALAPHV